MLCLKEIYLKHTERSNQNKYGTDMLISDKIE